MNINDLRPIGALQQNFGFKAIGYGPPGKGKTPLLATAPNPVILFTEPGMKSLGNCALPGYCAHTVAQIDDFMRWITESREAGQFQTVGIDSISEMAEIYLREYLYKNKDPRKAYGEMSKDVYKWLSALYHLKYKHCFLIAKETNDEVDGIKYKRPYFPGQDLHTRVPHLFDAILRIEDFIPSLGAPPLTAIRTRATPGIIARIRHADPQRFNEIEPPNLAALIAKFEA